MVKLDRIPKKTWKLTEYRLQQIIPPYAYCRTYNVFNLFCNDIKVQYYFTTDDFFFKINIPI